MSTKPRDELKQIFVNGAKPTETDFHDWLDSYQQVGENVAATNITGLSEQAMQNQTGDYQNASYRIRGTGEIVAGIIAGFPSGATSNTFYGTQKILSDSLPSKISMATPGIGIENDFVYDGANWTFYQVMNAGRNNYPPAGSVKLTTKVILDDAQHIVSINEIDTMSVDKLA